MGRISSGGSGRGLGLAALLLLGASTGGAFGRIFAGAGPSLVLAGAGAAAVIIANVLRRRHVLLTVALSGAALLLGLGLSVFPETTILGIPSGHTFRSLADALERVGTDAADAIPPVPSLDSLLAVSTIAVWCATTASALLVVRAGSPLVGLLPPGALLGFTGLVNAEGAYPAFALAFFVAALGVLFDSGLRHAGAWGPILPRSPSWYEAGGARRMALGTVAVVLVLPPFLPGFGSEALIDPGGADRGISIRALVDIRPSLNRKEAVELFRVSAEIPSYWRMVALDRFDGRVWSTTDPEGIYGHPVEVPSALAGAFSAPATTLRQTFEIRELAGAWLPLAYQPTFLDAGELSARYNEERGTIALPAGTTNGLRYEVVSQVVEPTPAELDRQLLVSHPSLQRQYTALPTDLPVAIGRVTRAVTEGQPTPYRKIVAIQNFLRTFTYDEQAPPGHGKSDLIHFLASRRGYCEQFAGTMAVMVRLLGYPSRVAVGFLPGEIGADGWFHVTTHQAHSWVEVFFPSYGWLAFEPTPTRRNPSATGYAQILGMNRTVPQIFPSEFGFLQIVGGGSGGVGGRPGFTLEPLGVARTANARPDVDEQGRPIPWLPLAGGGLGLALIATPVARAVRRAWQRSRVRTPRDGVLAWYRFFEERARDLGYGRASAETLAEYRSRLQDSAPMTGERLEKMIALTGSAAYSAAMVAGEQVEEAAALVRSLLRQLRSHAGTLGVVRGSLGLASLRRR